jgi:hypothetical protein
MLTEYIIPVFPQFFSEEQIFMELDLGVFHFFIVGLELVTETVKPKAHRNNTYEFHEVKI